MSDEEQDQETFESTDAGASETYPMEAGQIRKGGLCMLKGFPCKITNVAVSKTGKHGHAKCNFTGVDIFTQKKYEDMSASTHNMSVPNAFRNTYSLLDIDEDGALSLMEDSGDTKDDLNLPEDSELAEQIKSGFDEGKQLLIEVLRACGKEQVMSWKEDTSA